MGAPKKYEHEFHGAGGADVLRSLAGGRDSKVGAGRHVGALLDLARRR